MKTVKTKLFVLALLSAFSIQPSALHAQGSLTPPGVPAPTMKSLAQIEPRTPISSAPFTISSPGSYYLTTNLTTLTVAITIVNASGVTLDLNGFTIYSTAPSPTGTGILILGACTDIQIFNGHIIGGVTNNVNGVYSGTGFAYGITYLVFNPAPVNVRVAGVSVSGCLSYGIYLGQNSTLVESCTVNTVGSYGIYAQSVSGCMVVNGGDTGISAVTANNCYVVVIGTGTGLSAPVAQNCYVYNSGGGSGLDATTAQNCYGYSSSAYGLYATTALNCYGVSGSGYGLYATTAQNCYGVSVSDTGLYATTAQNCYGYNWGSGTGLVTAMAQNCYGYSQTGTGLTFTKMGAMCYGERGSPYNFSWVLGGGASGTYNLPP